MSTPTTEINKDSWQGLRGETKEYTPQFNVYENIHTFEILDAISRYLAKTFGPYGSTTIIEDRQMRHVHTKDGYTVLKALTSSNDLERVILEFIKRVSMRLVRTVGDGSTSAVIVSAAIADELKKFIETHPNVYAGDLNKALSKISEEIQSRITKMAMEINDDNTDLLNHVAEISTNNDKEVSNLICDVYKKVGKFGVVHVQEGDRPKTYVDYRTGFEMYRGYIDPVFVNKHIDDHEYCELDNAYIMMVEGTVGRTDIDTLTKILDYIFGNQLGAFVLIANQYTPEVKEFFRQNVIRSKNTMPVCLCEHGVGSAEGRNHFSDIAVYTDAHVVQFLSNNENIGRCFLDNNGNIDVAAFEYRMGFAKKVVAKELSTTFFEGKGVDKETYTSLKESLQKQIKFLGNDEGKFDYDSDLGKLKVRYGRLCACSAVINVGGKSKAEIQTNTYLVDDAVLAVRSAFQFGVVPGGNIVPAYILNNEETRKEIIDAAIEGNSSVTRENLAEIIQFVYDAYVKVFAIVSKLSQEEIVQMLNNKKIFNIRTRQYEDLNKTVVLNSARTDKEIIQGALSVVALISTSNQFIFAPKVF